MKMRLSKIALAIASLGTAQVVFALTPAQIAAGPTTYVWLSGNSAPSNGVFRSVMSLCNGLAGNAAPMTRICTWKAPAPNLERAVATGSPTLAP